MQDDGPPEIEASMKPLLQMPGVKGFMVINDAGIPIKWSHGGFSSEALPTASTIPSEITHMAALVSDMASKADLCAQRLFEPEESAPVQYLRLRTDERELIIVPSAAATLVVIQATPEAMKAEAAAAALAAEAADA